MSKIYFVSVMLVYLLIASDQSLAQQHITVKSIHAPISNFPSEKWSSESPNDRVTVENGTGANLNILISVNSNNEGTAPGIYVENCGETSHINAGSSAICVTNDSKNPVTFHSDSDETATGTYQITEQLPAVD